MDVNRQVPGFLSGIIFQDFLRYNHYLWIFHIRYRQQAPGRLLAIQLLPLV